MREPRARRTAAHDDLQHVAQGRVERDHLRGRTDEDVRRLERLDAADEQKHEAIGLDPEAVSSGLLVTGREAGEVDAGVYDGDTARVRVVQVDELLGLGVGVGDQAIGGVDHLLLADDPALGLGLVAVGEREVLDLRHRVHGVDERDVPPLGGKPADLAGEPVVRVHEVIPALGPHRLGAQDARGDRAELAGEVFLREALIRTRHDVAHGDSGIDLDRGRLIAGGRAGEDVDLDAVVGESSRKLGDVDVHAARVTGAGLVER